MAELWRLLARGCEEGEDVGEGTPVQDAIKVRAGAGGGKRRCKSHPVVATCAPRVQLAHHRRCTTPPAMQVVQGEAAQDAARTQRCCQSTARTEYRLSDADLKVWRWV